MVKTKNDVEIVEEYQTCDAVENYSIFNLLESLNLSFLKQEIFLYLDHASLHQARQVCQDWNMFIMERVWGSRMEREDGDGQEVVKAVEERGTSQERI